MVICLERGADLHMAQLIPLPLTVSCFSKIQIGFTFLVPAYRACPGQRAVMLVCVFMCVCVCNSLAAITWAIKLCSNNILQFLIGAAGSCRLSYVMAVKW